ncbi:Death-associated protein 1 [Larimichthys crocea]|uniref:Uncharacterized protein n=1 Tax=Larimichthys crocea TaxID=215358 RepID=A0ACD3QPH7_LARCR|nr:Death-associated protein 1 [Larimichthys crocea]
MQTLRFLLVADSGSEQNMSSPPKEKVETKGGHLPAVKAGGMRIVQKHQSAAAPEPPQKD